MTENVIRRLSQKNIWYQFLMTKPARSGQQLMASCWNETEIIIISINMHQLNSKQILFLFFFVNIYITGCISGGNRQFHHIWR